MGDLISETEPAGGGTTTYAYDLAGRTTSLTDPDDNITTWTYTQANEVATEVNPLGFSTTYSYDLDGNVTSVIDPNSHQITYAYNADNEETGETWVNPSGSPFNLVTITYDADGDVTKLQDANTNYQYTYNADDEVSTFADNGTTGLPLVTLTYGYDGDSNETKVSDSLGGLLTLSYDARDELTGEQFSGTGLSAEAVTYSYDNAGRLTGITRYSNLAETTEVAATAYSYDHDNRMTGIVDTNSTGTTLVSYGYTYDAANRVTQEVRTWNSGSNADTLTYGYTNNDQLTTVTHSNGSFSNESFAWDSNGNETGTGYTTGTDNEQTASPGYTYTYDNAGEMTSETQTSTGDVWTYGYDFRGRMVTAVEKTSGGTTLESVTYTYDALDNRIGMDENSTQTWTLYDQGSPIIDFSPSGSLTMRYLWGPTGIVARQTSGGTVSWYLADHLGTVRDIINNSGVIVDHVDFSAFGSVLDESSPTNGDRMTGFAMLERDSVIGLNLAVYRSANPMTAKWTSDDPSGFNGRDSNLYRYSQNDPIDSLDPSGLIDQGIEGGLLIVKPGLDPGGRIIVVIIEDFEEPFLMRGRPTQTRLGFPRKHMTRIRVDAVLIQGVGLYKIRAGAIAELLVNEQNGKPYVKCHSWFPPLWWTGGGHVQWPTGQGVVFFPVGTLNPFGPHGQVPGGPPNVRRKRGSIGPTRMNQ
jgi:RHS repeat-associated protein